MGIGITFSGQKWDKWGMITEGFAYPERRLIEED